MSIIEDSIRQQANKLIRRHETYASRLAKDLLRKEIRTGEPQEKIVQRPAYWEINRGFDPYYVRAHASAIARSMERSLDARKYSPRPAYEYEVFKQDGTARKVAVFQVADSALSTLTFRRLMSKNARHFSASAYAYRSDLTVHDAIMHASADMKSKIRCFTAEFDFKKYFDTISHEHLAKMWDDTRFFVTAREKHIMTRFLMVPSLNEADYDINTTCVRTRGIPQGTSVSLFLANLAAFPLDKRLERLGVGFARYADDTLIWADSYGDICRAANALEEVAYQMGVEINLMKSKGVNLLVPPGTKSEISSQNSIDFLGYSISHNALSIKVGKVSELKKNLSYLIYTNLLQGPKRGRMPQERVEGQIDRDYIVLLYQIRRYLYGGLNEATLRRFLRRQTPLIHYKGLMSFYPIVDDMQLLKSLDGWLIKAVIRALKLRRRLYFGLSAGPFPLPHGCTEAELLDLRYHHNISLVRDLRFPSFTRMSALLRRASSTYGASAIANIRSNRYYGV